MWMGALDILIVCLLIMLNGMFAMSELAVVSSRKIRLQQMAEEGDAKAELALDLAGNPQKFLATIQIGITLIGVLSGAFGGARIAGLLAEPLGNIPFLASYKETIALAIVVGLITYLSLLSELVPKRIALSWPEAIARRIAGPMETLSRFSSPLIHLLTASTELVLRFVGFRPQNDSPATEEEIRALIGQATVAGVFHEAEQEMVERVFRLGDRRVGVMMTPRNKIIWLDLAESPEKTRKKITKSHFSRFPVGVGRLGNIVGVVHVRSLALRCLNGRPLDLRDSMQKPIYVHEAMHALKVLELFRESGHQMALVVDEYGTIEGIVTLSDILESIVGDIPSAEEPEAPRIVQRSDGSWLVDGMLPADELKAYFRIRKLPGERTGGFYSLGGFIMTFLKRIPSVGDCFDCCGYSFEVVDMDGRRVDKVLITRLADPEAESDMQVH